MANQLDKGGMSPSERREAKAALVLAGRLQWWRKLMGEGKVERAAAYAKTYSFEAEAAEEAKSAKKMAEVIAANPDPVKEERFEDRFVPADMVEIKNPDEPVGDPGFVYERLINGWPVRVVGIVDKYPINPRMVLAKLPDGREVRLWNNGARRWKLDAKVNMKLEEAGEDAIYVGDFSDEA